MIQKVKHPTSDEVERLRLILSTYQDGSGMLAHEEGRTRPGWRDFERAVSLAFGGEAQESKFIFDVLLPSPDRPGVKYGLSCKMRSELDRVERDGRVTLELSNSAGKFWNHLRTRRIYQRNYKSRAHDVGIALIELVKQWHSEVSLDQGGSVDLGQSSYLVLSWNKAGEYQLHQFSLELPRGDELMWSFPQVEVRGHKSTSRRLAGYDTNGILFEWYGESGGQLKYYPMARTALWSSERFRLEPLLGDRRYGLLDKVAAYFPELWARVNRKPEARE